MLVLLDWWRNTKEILLWGANWQTIGAVGAISMTLLQVTGLILQIRRLTPAKNQAGGTVEFRVFAWNACLFLSCIPYAIDSMSIAILCSGFGLSLLHPLLLYRLIKLGEVSREQWRSAAFYPIMIGMIALSPEPVRSITFLLANVGAAIPMWKQFQRLGQADRSGNLDPRMLVLFAISLAFWVSYSFAIRHWVLMIVNPILFGLQVAILWRWHIIHKWEKRRTKFGVIFDCDMVLIDSFDASHRGFCVVCEQEPTKILELPDAETFGRICRQPFIKVFYDRGVTIEEERIWNIFRPHFCDTSLMRPYPGNIELLARLKQAGVRIAVSSSADDHITTEKLRHFGLLPYVEIVKGGSHSKVESMLTICQSFGLDPSQMIMVGDMESDMTDACEAGIHPFGLLGPFTTEEELRRAGARQIARTHSEMQQMLLSEFLSPSARRRVFFLR